MRFDTAESYFYPPPHEMTMRNIPGILEPKELEVVEYGVTSQRMTALYLRPSIVEHTYDAAHLCSIHRYLFQDIYVWAGEYRSVTLRKQGDPGFFAGIDQIDDYLHDANRIVKSTNWSGLDRSSFASAAADVFAYINQAHPFREGNGRASKVFMSHVSQQSCFELDYNLVSPEVWNNASQFSRPDLYKYEPVPDSLVPVFKTIPVERKPSV